MTTPQATKFVAYYRVSTQRQGQSGLGLEAQEADVERMVIQRGGVLLATYTEVESGRKKNRPELEKALRHCKATGATLIVAKFDRLARNTRYLLEILDSVKEIVACDMPTINRMVITILAAVAEEEARLISARTKAALAAKKARGEQVGGFREGAFKCDIAERQKKVAKALSEAADRHALEVAGFVRREYNAGKSLRGIARALNADGVKTLKGGKWYATTVKNLLKRLEVLAA